MVVGDSGTYHPLLCFTGNLRYVHKIEEIGEAEERCYHSTCYHLIRQNANYNIPK
jgi:hypothetical protein